MARPVPQIIDLVDDSDEETAMSTAASPDVASPPRMIDGAIVAPFHNYRKMIDEIYLSYEQSIIATNLDRSRSTHPSNVAPVFNYAELNIPRMSGFLPPNTIHEVFMVSGANHGMFAEAAYGGKSKIKSYNILLVVNGGLGEVALQSACIRPYDMIINVTLVQDTNGEMKNTPVRSDIGVTSRFMQLSENIAYYFSNHKQRIDERVAFIAVEANVKDWKHARTGFGKYLQTKVAANPKLTSNMGVVVDMFVNAAIPEMVIDEKQQTIPLKWALDLRQELVRTVQKNAVGIQNRHLFWLGSAQSPIVDSPILVPMVIRKEGSNTPVLKSFFDTVKTHMGHVELSFEEIIFFLHNNNDNEEKTQQTMEKLKSIQGKLGILSAHLDNDLEIEPFERSHKCSMRLESISRRNKLHSFEAVVKREMQIANLGGIVGTRTPSVSEVTPAILVSPDANLTPKYGLVSAMFMSSFAKMGYSSLNNGSQLLKAVIRIVGQYLQLEHLFGIDHFSKPSSAETDSVFKQTHASFEPEKYNTAEMFRIVFNQFKNSIVLNWGDPYIGDYIWTNMLHQMIEQIMRHNYRSKRSIDIPDDRRYFLRAPVCDVGTMGAILENHLHSHHKHVIFIGQGTGIQLENMSNLGLFGLSDGPFDRNTHLKFHTINTSNQELCRTRAAIQAIHSLSKMLSEQRLRHYFKQIMNKVVGATIFGSLGGMVECMKTCISLFIPPDEKRKMHSMTDTQEIMDFAQSMYTDRSKSVLFDPSREPFIMFVNNFNWSLERTLSFLRAVSL